MECRKKIIEKLSEQDDVDEVLKVFVSKSENYFDVDNLQWNKIDITLNSKKDSKCWQDNKFRRQIYSKCYLWDTFKDFAGECSREDLNRRRKENLDANLRMRGYVC